MMLLETEDLSGLFGSRVTGVDPSAPIDSDVAADMRALLSNRRLLLFRQGELTVEQQMRVASVFGPVIVEAPTGEPWSLVTNLDPMGYVTGSDKLVFHADYQFTVYGPLEVISLYAAVMERGEPTSYANMIAGAARLPAQLRARLETLNVVQLLDLSSNFSESRRSRMSARQPDKPDSQYPHSTQPLIQTHPRTGEPYINISQMQTSHVDGWNDADSEALFQEIEQHLYVPENIYTHIWQEHDLLVWDNVALQHGREPLAAGARRTLRRVAVNTIDVPTMMSEVRPDAARFPGIQWKDNAAA